MRGLIILCFSAVTLAAPQGYNYNPSAGGASAGGSLSAGGSSFSGSSSFGGGFGSGSSLSPSFGAGSGGFSGAQQGGYPSQGPGDYHGQAEPIVTKRFFIHSAPEEHDDDYKERHITVGVPKKNYNVVFIKAPSKGNKKTTLKITPAVNEEKTVVYVLTKKGENSEINTEVLEQPTPTAKPEVFFIKYKTAEEAAHAQEQIQAQYDALGGSSQVTDEGVAPVSSVIGSLGGAGGAGGAAGGGGYPASSGGSSGSGFSNAAAPSGLYGGVPSAPAGGVRAGNAYLPPAFH